MSKVVVDITMSLDGFVAGPNDGPGNGLGDGGEVLHYWVFGGPWTYQDDTERKLGSATGVDKEVLDEAMGSEGAVIVGRGMFEAAGGWGYTNPFPVPVFVLTHHADEQLRAKASGFTFVTDGINSALAKARAAGSGDVGIGGGASVCQQYLAAGLVDEMQIHVAPVLLGGGTRLFEHLGDAQVRLEPVRVRESPYATHVRYRVVK